jgi:hypothetical protein
VVVSTELDEIIMTSVDQEHYVGGRVEIRDAEPSSFGTSEFSMAAEVAVVLLIILIIGWPLQTVPSILLLPRAWILKVSLPPLADALTP